jgi:hypothetical protein
MNVVHCSPRSCVHSFLIVLIAAIAIALPQNALAQTDCGATPELTIPAGPTGCDVQFGLSTQFERGTEASVALNSSNWVVETHKSPENTDLWYRLGKLNGNIVTWGDSHRIGVGGHWPAVVLSKQGYVIEVHSDQKDRDGATMYYEAGKIDLNGDVNQSIDWRVFDTKYDAGFRANIAINDDGVIVGVHESMGSSNRLYYRRGHMANPAGGDFTIIWNSGHYGIGYDNGAIAHIAINNKGQVVEVHQVNKEHLLHYRRGDITADGVGINFQETVRYNNDGLQPAVALTDNGFALEVNATANTTTNHVLDRMVGALDPVNPALINWSQARTYDPSAGLRGEPAVATNGAYAIQTNEESEVDINPAYPLNYSASAIRDRNDWMRDRLDSLGDKSLSKIVIPGADQAGMYENKGGSAQDEPIVNQLEGGVRFFDVRVKQSSPGQLDTYVSFGPDEYIGAPVQDILIDVENFLNANDKRREVVVLKFSHFKNMGACSPVEWSPGYQILQLMVNNLLGHRLLLYTGVQRPADISLNTLLADGSKVIVLVDGDYASSKCAQEQAGFYVYRDWCSGELGCAGTGGPALGQFNVFDQVSFTADFNSMRNNQLEGFRIFNGKMKSDPNITCDEFLLAWILGNPGSRVDNISKLSEPANANLGDEMYKLEANPLRFIPNVLSVDYYERARVTDTAIEMNKRLIAP